MPSSLAVLRDSRDPHDTKAAEPKKPSDWKWQLRNTITTVEALESTFRLTDDERAGAQAAVQAGFPLSITPHYASLCDVDDPSCPVRRQCVPSAKESIEAPGDLR